MWRDAEFGKFFIGLKELAFIDNHSVDGANLSARKSLLAGNGRMVMRLLLIQDLDDCSAHSQDIKDFIERVGAKNSSHAIDALIDWFVNFRSDDSAGFAARRGLNFLGKKSGLKSLFFMLIYQDDEIVAFAPLFRFEVNFGGAPGSCEVIAFCPDSTIFFYSDILIKEGFDAIAIQSMFSFLRQYNRTSPYVVLFNHIPSTSGNLSLILKNAMELSDDNFNIGMSPVCRRGGLYPWNLSDLRIILKEALNNNCLATSVLKNIQVAVSEIESTSAVMLAFGQNHLSLKSTIYRIFAEEKKSEVLLELYRAVESIFQSHPVRYPYLALPGDYEAFVATLSPSKQYYYRRYRKQFNGNGREIAKIHGESISDQDIKSFMDLHSERWGNKSNILNKRTSAFVFSFLQKMAKNELLTLFFAKDNAENVACVCCIDFKERREFLSSGRSLNAEKLRAGKILLYEVIVDSIAEGFKFFDFGYGDEAYKSDYNCSYITNNAIGIFHKIKPNQCHDLLPMYEELMM